MRGISRLLISGVLGVSLIVLPACSAASSSPVAGSSVEDEIHYVDEDFMKALARGLEARWALAENEPDDIYASNENEREWFTTLVNAELDEIEQYGSGQFEDTKLQADAILYINLLKDQLESLDYINADYSKYADMWADAYDARSQMIVKFVEDYGLTVSDEYADQLREFRINAALVSDKEAKQEAVESLARGISFEEEGDGDYVAIVENTTGFDLASFSAEVTLRDADGVIVDTAYVSVSNWKNGERAKLDFYTYESFETTEVVISWWEEA